MYYLLLTQPLLLIQPRQVISLQIVEAQLLVLALDQLLDLSPGDTRPVSLEGHPTLPCTYIKNILKKIIFL